MIRVPRRLRHQAHRRFLCMYACVLCERVCVLQRRVRRAASIIITSAYAHPKIIKLHLSSQWEAIYIYIYVLSGWVDGWMPVQLHQTRKKYIGGLAYSTQRLLSLKNLPLSYVQNSTPVQSAPRSLCVLL